MPAAEIPVNWHDVEGSKLNIVQDSIKMARDFLLVRLLYILRLWKYSDDIGY
jgi:dolichyl-phosphate beta-glucosyltransferase